MIKYNNNTINDWNFGDDNIVKVYRGVKGNPKHNYEEDYLTLVAETDNVSVSYSTATSGNKLKYSLDSGETWSELGNNQSTSAINSGEKILFKASGLTVNTERGIGKIIPSALASVEGNIMSLAYGDDFIGQTVIPNNFQFRKLFSGDTSITSAENMALPATTVKKQCYSQMFQACTNLAKTPKVIGSSAMTWDGDYCFSDMFNSCTSLTTVPSGLLPAKNLSSACYWCFFQYCSNLTNTPLLPATTLVSNCYLEMFKGCTNLNHIEALFTTTPSSSYMSNWVSGVTNSGTFYKNSEATWSSSCGTSTYPCNWTVENYVPSDNQEEESSDYVGVVVYYKVITSGGTPEYKVCYAVVDDISQYSETEFEDVYDKATEKWYKLNNLNQYEEYGVYASGRTECSGTSRLPQGYTEIEYIENPNLAYIDSGFKPNQDTRILFTFKFEQSQSASMLIGAGGWDRTDGMLFDYEQNLSGTLHISWGGTTVWDVVSSVNGDYNVHTYDWNKNKFYIDDTLVSSTTYRTFQCSDNLGIFSVIQYPYSPFGQQYFACGRLYDFKIYDNGTLVRDLVPCINPSNAAGMYDIVNDVFYTSAYNGYNFVGGDPIAPTDCVTTYEGKLTIDTESIPSPSRLPSGYTEVEYIEDSGSQYIDTGVYLNTSNFEIGYTIADKKQHFGYCHQGCGSCTWLGAEQSAIMWWGDFNNNANIASYLTTGENVITFTPSGATVNGNSISKTLRIGSDDISNISLPIFARYDFRINAIEYRTDSYTKLKSFYIKNGGTLVRDFVPAMRNSDSKYGLYDLISDTFFTSPNGNNFIGGSAVTPPSTTATCEYIYSGNSWVNVGEVSGSSRLPQGYTEVEYIRHSNDVRVQNVWSVPNDAVDGNIYTVDLLLDSASQQNVSRYIALFGWGSGYCQRTNRTAGDQTNVGYYTSNGLHKNNTIGNYYQEYDVKLRYRMTTSALTITNTQTSAVATIDFTVESGSYNGGNFGVFSYTGSDNGAYQMRGNIYQIIIEGSDNTIKHQYIPCQRDSDSKYGLYDLIGQEFYYPTTITISGGSATTQVEYPMYYDDKSDPLNNLTFSSMTEANQYAYNNCVYDGMKATIDGVKYIFSGDSQSGYEWVEDTNHYLPNVPFSLNYNARQYDTSTNKIPQTDGQLQNVDAVCNYGSGVVDHSADGYISITSDTRFICSGNNGTYINRTNTQTGCTMTIVSKAKTTNGYSIFTNRLNSYYRQYMYRQDTSGMYLCGTGNTTPLACSNSVPSIISIKVYYNGGVKASATNHTNGNILAEESYAYNNQSSTNAGALFCDYAINNSEFWKGDFYWIYMSQNVLTDEQIQQVIDYNENL